MKEKPPLHSKKFLAYLLAQVSWSASVILWIIHPMDSMWWTVSMVALIVVKGFLEVAFISSQAALDKYVRLAEIAADTVDGGKGAGSSH